MKEVEIYRGKEVDFYGQPAVVLVKHINKVLISVMMDGGPVERAVSYSDLKEQSNENE